MLYLVLETRMLIVNNNNGLQSSVALVVDIVSHNSLDIFCIGLSLGGFREKYFIT